MSGAGVSLPVRTMSGDRFRPAGRILKRSDHAVYRSAVDLRQRADALEQSVAERVRAAELAARQQGYEAGKAAGAATAAADATAVMTALTAHLDRLEPMLIDLVLAVVRDLIGGLPEDERHVLLVRRAMSEFQDATLLAVRVHPSARGRCLALLAETGARARLETDGDLAPDDAVLVTPAGVIRCALDAQLAALRRSTLEALSSGDDR